VAEGFHRAYAPENLLGDRTGLCGSGQALASVALVQAAVDPEGGQQEGEDGQGQQREENRGEKHED
jgi:hypothetical protein